MLTNLSFLMHHRQALSPCFGQLGAIVFVVENTMCDTQDEAAVCWGVFLYVHFRMMKMFDATATLLAAFSDAEIYDAPVVAIFEAESSSIPRYVAASLAIEVKARARYLVRCLILY